MFLQICCQFFIDLFARFSQNLFARFSHLMFFARFAVDTKLLEFNSVMGGGGKQSTVKKYNKVNSHC